MLPTLTNAMGSWLLCTLTGHETPTVTTMFGFLRFRLRALPRFGHSVDQAKWKGYLDVDLCMRHGDGAAVGGTLPLRLRAVAVKPGTRSYGEKLRVRLSPLRGKVQLVVIVRLVSRL